MQTYTDAYKKIKNGPWKNFFDTQDQLKDVTKHLDSISSPNVNHYTDDLNIYPKPEQTFRVFDTKPEDIKVVILGQDPFI